MTDLKKHLALKEARETQCHSCSFFYKEYIQSIDHWSKKCRTDRNGPYIQDCPSHYSGKQTTLEQY